MNQQNNFAKRLKEERFHAGFTQKQVAEHLGIATDTYKGYESQGAVRHRDPSFETLVKLAILFNTTTDYLLGKDEV